MEIIIVVVVTCLILAWYYHAKFYTTAVIVEIYDRFYIKVGNEFVDIMEALPAINKDWIILMLWKPESRYCQAYLGTYTRELAEGLMPIVQDYVDNGFVYVHEQGRFLYKQPNTVGYWSKANRDTKQLQEVLKIHGWGI